MPDTLRTPLLGAENAALRDVTEAAEHARHMAVAVDEARDRALEARGRLAEVVRKRSASIFGTVRNFAYCVETSRGVPVATVWNCLYSTYTAATLAVCVDVLTDTLCRPEAEDSRRAA